MAAGEKILTDKKSIDKLIDEAWNLRVIDSETSYKLCGQIIELAGASDYDQGIAWGKTISALYLVRQSRNDDAYAMLNSALPVFEKQQNLKGLAVIYEYMSLVERNWGNYSKAIDFLSKTFPLSEQTGFTEHLVTNHYQLGVTYKLLGNFQKALEQLFDARMRAKEIKNDLFEAYAINVIGSIYFETGEYSKALEYLLQGLGPRQLAGDKWGVAGSLIYIGYAYLKLKDYPEAKKYCKRGLMITREIGDKRGESNALCYLAEIEKERGIPGKAKSFYKESLEIRSSTGDKRGQAEIIFYLSELEEGTEKSELLQRSLALAEQVHAVDLIIKIRQRLYEYFKNQGKFQEAIFQLEEHNRLESELHSNTVAQKVQNLEITLRAEELAKFNSEIEKKNRELEIEASLEKVRAQAMGMHKPDDMLMVCRMISDQLLILGFKDLRNVQTAIIYKERHEYLNYQYFTAYDKDLVESIDYRLHPDVMEFTNQILSSTDAYYTKTFEGKELEEWREYRRRTNQLSDPKLDETSSAHYYFYSIGVGALGVTTYAPLSDEQINLFKRFRNVFKLAYKRFIDIEIALNQAREAQIEAALERVRSRAMAMHKTQELLEAAELLFKELSLLGVTSMNVSYALVDNDEKYATYYSVNPVDGKVIPFPFVFPHTETEVMRSILSSWKKQEPYNVIELDEGATLKHQTYIGEHIQQLITKENVNIPFSIETFLEISPKTAVIYTFNFAKGYIFNIGETRLSQIQEDLLLRFTKVFEQTYIRFLDIQKAEAQARESEIQLALERVRARTMAMQKSDELPDAANLLFLQVQSLKIPAWSAGYCIWEENKRAVKLWMSTEGTLQEPFTAPTTEDPLFIRMREAHEKGDAFHVVEMGGEELVTHYKYMRSLPVIGKILDSIVEAGHPLPTFQIMHYAYFSHGFLLFITYEPIPAAHDIFKRFASVFEQTYTRFLDLQKAEAQAREAKIEAALERVRSKTMAMQSSAELSETSFLLFKQLKELGETAEQLSIGIFNEEQRIFELSATIHGNAMHQSIRVHLDEPIAITKVYDAWKQQKKSLVLVIKGDELRKYNAYRNTLSEVKFDTSSDAQWVIHAAFFSRGAIVFSDTKVHPNSTLHLVERFAGVFDQTYRRFLDLQRAEAQAREAKIEAALERVRAKAMAMHSSEDITPAVSVVFEEMEKLDLNTLRVGIGILSNEQMIGEVWTTHKEKGDKIHVSGNEPLDIHPLLEGAYKAWQQNVEFEYDLEGEDQVRYYQAVSKTNFHLPKSQQIFHASDETRQFYFCTPFESGNLFAFSKTKFTGESKSVMRRFANVFNITYKRFQDLQKAESLARKAEEDLVLLKEEKLRTEQALAELKATQAQLIQSEKMASLGELTAGIAHEIQNPLNFVNNFAEVNSELIEEAKAELSTGNIQMAGTLLDNLKENESKILHHGKRADGIVKSMLQHSRSGSGQKELIDINLLAEEYLKLAYHGLRAKDKSFNAKFETDFDTSVEKVSVVAQDIGRVLLNLINNAFYAVSKKAVSANKSGYQPTVTVSTKKSNGNLELRVKDNGTGIPENMVSKIFQPFFTTKPSGQGTGLGLSLSYDIIKSHGGKIDVSSEADKGSEFIISIPY